MVDLHACICVRACGRVHACACMQHIGAYIYTCVHACMYIHVCMYIHACTYIHACMHTYACRYACTRLLRESPQPREESLGIYLLTHSLTYILTLVRARSRAKKMRGPSSMRCT